MAELRNNNPYLCQAPIYWKRPKYYASCQYQGLYFWHYKGW